MMSGCWAAEAADRPSLADCSARLGSLPLLGLSLSFTAFPRPVTAFPRPVTAFPRPFTAFPRLDGMEAEAAPTVELATPFGMAVGGPGKVAVVGATPIPALDPELDLATPSMYSKSAAKAADQKLGLDTAALPDTAVDECARLLHSR